MRGHHFLLVAAFLGGTRPVHAEAAAAVASSAVVAGSAAGPQAPSENDAGSEPTTDRGLAYHPSEPSLHAFRLAIGGFYDAIDPQVMYGYDVRLPRLNLDARYGLGSGWSLKGTFNTMLVTTELLLGASYGWNFQHWSIEAAASVGIYVGKLGYFGFDALVLSPQYRPEFALGYDFGDMAVSFRGSLLWMGPERVRVGEVWGGLDNSSPFAGHSEMLYVENRLSDGAAWYFGLGLLTTRAYYALWLLFPDSPALFTYPRIAVGYEF